jgi:NADH dehydrogenase (ubiquinone) 1 beta subcomplex subunit 5
MGGHKKTINIVPGKYETKHWLDRVHLYTMLAVIPAAAIIAYANLFVGQAKLVDIPEDYEPKHWEYHKHPIARFWAKYVVENPVRVYEINLHHLWDVREKRRLRLLESKVKSLMNQRQDVKTWYYVPVNSEQMVYAGYHARKEEEKTFGR